MDTKKIADISWYVEGNVLVKCERFKYQGSRSLGSESGHSNKEPISVLTILYLVSYKLSMS